MSQLWMQVMPVAQNRRMRPILIFSFLLLLLIAAVVGATSPWKKSGRKKEVRYNSFSNYVHPTNTFRMWANILRREWMRSEAQEVWILSVKKSQRR